MKQNSMLVIALCMSALTFAQASKIPARDIELRSGGYTQFGSVHAKVVKFGGHSTPECKLAISTDGRYFYLTKMHSTCWKGTNRNGVKIICNANKSICKTRGELISFVTNRGSMPSNSSSHGSRNSSGASKDTVLRSGGHTQFSSVRAKVVKFGGYSTPECKLAISTDGRYFYLTKMHSTCWKGTNRNGVKIICNSNKSICKTRSELRDFVANRRSTSSNSSSHGSRSSSGVSNSDKIVLSVVGAGLKWLFSGGGSSSSSSSQARLARQSSYATNYGLPKSQCYLTSGNYALNQYCNYGKCNGFASNYAMHQLCKYDNPNGFYNSNRETNIRLYLTGSASQLSYDYFSNDAAFQSGRHNGSFQERKNFILYLLSGKLLRRY